MDKETVIDLLDEAVLAADEARNDALTAGENTAWTNVIGSIITVKSTLEQELAPPVEPSSGIDPETGIGTPTAAEQAYAETGIHPEDGTSDISGGVTTSGENVDLPLDSGTPTETESTETVQTPDTKTTSGTSENDDSETELDDDDDDDEDNDRGDVEDMQ